MSERVLEIKHLNAGYASHGLGLFRKREYVPVLKDINLNIERNEFMGLVGESGSGKSTLGKSVLALIPFEGSVSVAGQSYSKKNRRAFYRNVQAVFQDPLSALDEREKIGRTLAEPLVIHGIGTAKERAVRVDEMLEMIGLDASYGRRYPKELSGGQRQRVCIGAALMLRPKLLVADEAISSLDVSVGSQILNLFQEIHGRMEFSMLFISHNLTVVYYLCDRIAVMNEGRIVECGEAEKICFSPEHPYTKKLVGLNGIN